MIVQRKHQIAATLVSLRVLLLVRQRRHVFLNFRSEFCVLRVGLRATCFMFAFVSVKATQTRPTDRPDITTHVHPHSVQSEGDLGESSREDGSLDIAFGSGGHTVCRLLESAQCGC
jgi:hypothetical protein